MEILKIFTFLAFYMSKNTEGRYTLDWIQMSGFSTFFSNNFRAKSLNLLRRGLSVKCVPSLGFERTMGPKRSPAFNVWTVNLSKF